MTQPTISRQFPLTLVLLISFVVAGAALAQPGPRGRDHRGALHAYRTALAQVGLSDEQKVQLRALADGKRAEGAALRAQHAADRAHLRALLAVESPDPVAVGNAVLAIEKHREQMRSSRRAMHEATLAILTAEQRIAFEASLDTLRAVERRRSDRRR